MPLQEGTIQVPFAQGVDLKTDPKQVMPLKLLRLTNGLLTKPGKIVKRNGYDSLGNSVISSTGTTTRAGGEALGTFKNELLTFYQSTAYSRSTFSSADISKGQVVPLTYDSSVIVKNEASQTYADFASLNGVNLYAWQDSRGGIRATVVDEATGNAYLTDTSINSGATKPRVRAIGSFLFVFYVETATNTVKFKRLNPSQPFTFLTEQSLVASLDATNPNYDLAPLGNACVWASHKSGGSIDIGYVDQYGGATGYPAAINLAEAATNCLSVVVNSTTQQIFIFFHNGTNGTRVKGYDNTLTSLFSTLTIENTTAPTTVNITAQFTSTLSMTVFYEVNNATSTKHLVKKATVSSGGSLTVAPAVLKRSVGLASKAWIQNSNVYVAILHDSPLQATYFAMDSSGNLVSKMVSQNAGSLQTSFLPQVNQLSTGIWSFSAPFKTTLQTNSSTNFYSNTGVKRMNLNFVSTDRYYNTEMNGNLHITGGILSVYDGQSIVEHGFHVYPEGITNSASASGGSMSDGSYQNIAIYTWTDAQGNVHRSETSIPLTSTLSGGGTSQSNTLTIPTLRLTAKTSPRSEVTIEVYRTTNGGTTFFLSGTVANDPTADTVTFTDTLSDSSLGSRRLLYTTGGVLDNSTIPAVKFIAATKNRLVVGPDEDGQFWYSKEKVVGEAMAFAAEFTIPLDPQGGSASGVTTLDEKIIISKLRGLSYVAGQGPNELGEQNDFSDPISIPTDAGVKDPNSIVITGFGACYKSEKGIYVLDRSLNASYIGAPVEYYNSARVVSADLIASKNQVRFFLDSGVCLVWNYLSYLNQQGNDWSVFENHSANDSTLWNGVLVYLRSSNGAIYKENENSYLDDNQSIQLDVETAWLKTEGIQNFGRIWRAIALGDYKSAHKLQVDVYYDYQDYAEHSYIWDPSTALQTSLCGGGATAGADSVCGGVSDGVYQARIHLARQKCQAIKFRFRDVMTDTFGESFSLSHLALKVGLKPGLNRLKSSKSI